MSKGCWKDVNGRAPGGVEVIGRVAGKARVLQDEAGSAFTSLVIVVADAATGDIGGFVGHRRADERQIAVGVGNATTRL